MNRPQFFTHRPPTLGIHLLSDPFPERLNGTASLFTRAESLSAQREHIAVSSRLRQTSALKKK